MLFPIYIQARFFIFSLLAGVITGVLFDSYRLIRGFENPNKVLTFIQDILFWIFSSIVVFIFLVYTKCTFLGVYAYMFIAIGVLLYMKIASKTFLSIQFTFISALIKFFRVTINIAVYPFKLVLYKLILKNKRKY